MDWHPDRIWRTRFGVACAAVAVVLLALALQQGGTTGWFVATAGRASGEVIGHEPDLDPKTGQPRPGVHLKVEFPDRNGQFRRFTERAVVTGSDITGVGGEVSVIYDKKRPANARVLDYLGLFGYAAHLGIASLIAGVAAEELLRGGTGRRARTLAD